MSAPATIDHKEVHVDLHNKGSGPYVVTEQPGWNNGSAGQPAGSGVHYDSQTAMAVFTHSPPPIVAQKPDNKLKPKDFVMTSCFVVFACNFIFGLLGYHFGVKSNHAWRLGDINQARVHAGRALTFVIIGILVGLLTYGLVFGLYFGVHRTEHNI